MKILQKTNSLIDIPGIDVSKIDPEYHTIVANIVIQMSRDCAEYNHEAFMANAYKLLIIGHLAKNIWRE